MTATIEVSLAGQSYAIRVGRGLLGAAGAGELAGFVSGRACALVSDERVGLLYFEAAGELLARAGAAAVHRIAFPPGEASKTLATVAGFYGECVRAGLDRTGVVVALGGGVTGDMAGFLAATYLRGVDLVQIPTSLLAMVDSAVGGKTGVDLPEGKNLIGAFKQPRRVLIDLDVLRTLAPRELRSGLAEVAKYGVALDARLFEYLEAHTGALLALDPAVLEHVVTRCCELKSAVVAEDELDLAGRRAVLNYGHTFGHALEQVTGFVGPTHGEAVAVGMMMAAELAAARQPGLRTLVARQESLWNALGLPTRAVGLDSPASIAAAMRTDKKAERGELRLILPSALGDCRLVRGVSEREVLAAIERRCAP